MAKVSIIVPIFNTEKYLKKCIDSLVNQTERDIEIILINDGSFGNVSGIVSKYKDNRILYIEKSNEGIGKTRNLGISKSTGEYLMFIDSDDYIDINCVKKMYDRAFKDNLDVLISDFYEDHDGKIAEKRYNSFENTNLKKNPTLINNVNLGPCNKIFKKTLFNDANIRFEENLKYEDVPFLLKILVKARSIGKIDECLSYYVIHEKSETTIHDERIFDILKITKIIIDELSIYPYLKTSLVNVVVMILCDYTIQQRNISDRKMRSLFIDSAFAMLNDLDKRWRKCEYLKKFPLVKRIIKSNHFLTKIYCTLYNFKMKNMLKLKG